MSGLTLTMNGETRRVRRTGKVIRGWEDVELFGEDSTGRTCVVGAFSLPVSFLERGGRIVTGGSTFELLRSGNHD